MMGGPALIHCRACSREGVRRAGCGDDQHAMVVHILEIGRCARGIGVAMLVAF